MSLTTNEAKYALRNLIMNGMGMTSYNKQGAAYLDSSFYCCSACGATKSAEGYDALDAQLGDVDHKENCELVKLAKWANE